MNGTKPTNIVTREFRGARLYLQSNNRAARYWSWTADKAKAMRLFMNDALDSSERAAREWGAKCAVIDAQGNLAASDAQAGQPLIIGTRKITELGTNDYAVGCATCGFASSKALTMAHAVRIATRDSKKSCKACGAQS
jgi:hypothetical protein